MKLCIWAIGLVLIVVVNCYGIHWTFAAMTYPNDGTFVAGFLGFVILLVLDVLLGQWAATKLYRKWKVNDEK